MLQEIVSCELDLLVPPFRGAVYACVTGLRLIRGALGKAEVPGGILLPRVALQEGVLGISAWLHVTPIAVQHVLPGIDQPAAEVYYGLVQCVPRHVVTRLPESRQSAEMSVSWAKPSQS